jgi:hypothetical protein
LSMKHANSPKSSNALVSIVMDLLYLIVISNKKQVVRSKSKLGPFWTHDASKSNFAILIEIGHPHFSSLKRWHVNGSGLSWCDSCFLGQLVMMWLGFPQYMHISFKYRCHFSYFVNVLNHVWSIYVGSSFDVDVVDGNNIANTKFFGTINDSQHFFCSHSKSLLLQWTA